MLYIANLLTIDKNYDVTVSVSKKYISVANMILSDRIILKLGVVNNLFNAAFHLFFFLINQELSVFLRAPVHVLNRNKSPLY